MPIDEATHRALDRVELLALIDACERCECDFECYCDSNRRWAGAKLQRLNEQLTEGSKPCK